MTTSVLQKFGLVFTFIILAATFAEAADNGYRVAVTASQPVVYFRLNETIGNYYSLTGDYTGTPANTTPCTGPCAISSDNFLFTGLEVTNTGATFTANPLGPSSTSAVSYITIPHAAALNPGTGSLTLEAWIKIPAAYANDTEGNVMMKMGDTNFSYRTGYSLATICDTNTGMMYVFGQIRDGEATYANAAFKTPQAALSLNAWHYVAAVFSRNPPGTADTATLYVDGTPQGTTTGSVLKVGNVVSGATQDIQPLSSLGLGCAMAYNASDYGFALRGYADELALYTKALSATEISNHWIAAATATRPAVTVPVTNGLLVALQGGSAATTSAGRVTCWFDSAPLGGWQDFRQLTNAYQAGLVQATMPDDRSHSVIEFNPVNTNHLELPSTARMDTNTWTWFVVFKPNTAGSSARILLRSAYTNGAGIGSGTLWGSFIDAPSPEFRSHTRQSGSAIATPAFLPAISNQWFVMGAIWNGAASAINGRAATSIAAQLHDQHHIAYPLSAGVNTNSADANPSGHLLTRIGVNSGDYSGSFDGQIAEILIYNTPLSEADATAVMMYLEQKYLLRLSGTVFTMR